MVYFKKGDKVNLVFDLKSAIIADIIKGTFKNQPYLCESVKLFSLKNSMLSEGKLEVGNDCLIALLRYFNEIDFTIDECFTHQGNGVVDSYTIKELPGTRFAYYLLHKP